MLSWYLMWLSHAVLLVTSCLLPRIRQFVHTQHLNSRFRGSKHGVTHLIRGQAMFHILKRFCSFEIRSLPFISGLNHYINTVLLGRIAAARKADGGRDHHCDVINHVPFSLYSTLMTSTCDTCMYFTVVSQSEARVRAEHGIKYKTVAKSVMRSSNDSWLSV